MNDEHKLPEGWTQANLGDISYIVGGSTPSRSEPSYFGGKTVWLTPTEIPKETVSIVSESKQTLTEEGFNASGVRLIPPGSVLLTSRASIGYTAIAGNFLTTNQGFASFVLSANIEPKYLAWWLKSQKTRLENLASGTTFKEISKAVLRDVPVPLAPFAEQRRIVEAIERHFSHLDAVIAELHQKQKQLKRYRASVLKAAIEGKLTEKWRVEHPDVEPAPVLLKHILEERHARWKADLIAKRKDPEKAKYVEPVAPDVKDPRELPEGWCWATVEQTSYFVKYGTSAKSSRDLSGIPVLRMGNIQDGMLHFNDLKYLPADHPEFPMLLLQKEDLLFNRTNSAELVGKSAIYEGNLNPCSYASYLICVRFLTGISSRYVNFFLNSWYGRFWASSVATQQVGQANINGTKLQALTFALPSLEEQEQIVAEIERHLSLVRNWEEVVENSLKVAQGLRQTVLREAFVGRLVEQNPEEEPASVLLERIQAEHKQLQKVKLLPTVEGEPTPIDPGMVQRGLWEDDQLG